MNSRLLVFLLISGFVAACVSVDHNPTVIPTPPALTETTTPTQNPARSSIQVKFLPVPSQVAFRGESFPPLNLAGFLSFRRLEPDQITWSATCEGPLAVDLANGILKVSKPNDSWFGSGGIQVKACETSENCTSQNVEYQSVDEDPSKYVRVTYVTNSGFLVSAGGKKILIDALIGGLKEPAMPDYETQLIQNSQPPFDHIDLILATHAHGDHFSASMVADYLEKNPGTVFISTTQATSQMPGFGERVIALDAREGNPQEANVNGINVKAIYISHGTPPAGEEEIYNNGYVVDINGFKLFHMGDIEEIRDVEPYDLPASKLDLAFIVHFLFYNSSSRNIIANKIAARYVIPIHYLFTTPGINFSDIQTMFPVAVLFHSELESWIMPPQ